MKILNLAESLNTTERKNDLYTVTKLKKNLVSQSLYRSFPTLCVFHQTNNISHCSLAPWSPHFNCKHSIKVYTSSGYFTLAQKIYKVWKKKQKEKDTTASSLSLGVRKTLMGKWKSLPQVLWSLAMALLWNLTHQQYFYQLWLFHLLAHDPKIPEKICLRGFQQCF